VFYFSLPLLNQLTAKTLLFEAVVDAPLVLASGTLLIFITLMAGGYPAYFITQFESINALKGGANLGSGSQWFRKSLVVVQLTIACMLLCGAILIIKQMHFISSRPLGFAREHIVNVPLFSDNLNGIFRQKDSTFRTRLDTYRNMILSQTDVNHTTLSSNAPGVGVIFRGVIPEGFTREDNLFIADLSVDYDFLKAYNMTVIAGRNFNKDFGTDEKEAFIINETAVKEFNWGIPQQAIGKTINREGKIGKVVGVVRDFHFSSLTTPISAMVLEVNPLQFNTLSISFNNGNVKRTIKKLESTWNELFPEKSFEFRFLDDQLEEQYASFSNFSTIIQTFTFIAILISCLGVYGLVLYVVQRKVKEIGIRKVLGASVNSILTLICRDFALLIAIGFLLAIPASWYLLNEWLKNFTYHTELDVKTYLISFAVVLVIVVMTISYQAIKASLANPVDALRSE
jgi:putative ABC transport system permease protein